MATALLATDPLERDLDSFGARTPTFFEFQNISDGLEAAGHPDLAQIPRLYYVLRTIQLLDALPIFIAHGATDMWFPFPKPLLRGLITDYDLQKLFHETEESIYATELPLGSFRGHLNFEDEGSVGFEDEKRSLGDGKSGNVYAVRIRSTNRVLAQKVIWRTKTESSHRECMTAFTRELKVLRQVHHQHCVELVASYTESDTVVLLFDPVADMNLAKLLEETKLDATQKKVLGKSLGCLSSALLYLHNNDIRHKDIKPQNVLVHGQKVMFTDFGLSHHFPGKHSTTYGDSHNTPRYAPPEALEKEPRNRSSDIWSLGCVFLQILSRILEHPADRLTEFWKHNGSEDSIFAKNPEASRMWCDNLIGAKRVAQFGLPRKLLMGVGLVFEGMLNVDPTFRPTARQLFARLADLDTVYPHDDFAIGPCCSPSSHIHHQALAITSDDGEGPQALSTDPTATKFRRSSEPQRTDCGPVFLDSHVPQWPLPDLFAIDKNLYYAFFSINNLLLAKHEHLSIESLSRLRRINDSATVKALAQTNTDRQALSLHSSTLNAKRAVLSKTLIHSSRTTGLKDTKFLVFQIEWSVGSNEELRTVQLAMSSICFHRSEFFHMPYFLLLLDPREDNLETGTDNFRRGLWAEGLGPGCLAMRQQVLERRTLVVETARAREEARRSLYIIPCEWCKIRRISCSGPTERESCPPCRQIHLERKKCQGNRNDIENEWPEQLRNR